MSQQKPPRPELVPSPSKPVVASKPQANLQIPKPALVPVAASEPSPKPNMQAFDVAIALATERLQSSQPNASAPPQPVAPSDGIAAVPSRVATAELVSASARRNETSCPVILIQQATGLTVPTHTQTVSTRGAVVAVKQALVEGSSVTLVNPANARNAEGTVLWCDGSSAEIEFREAIPTFWQHEPATKTSPVRSEPKTTDTEVVRVRDNDVVSMAESIDFPKPVEVKLVSAQSSGDSLPHAAQLFGEQTKQRRNVRPFVIAITTVALLSGVGVSGVALSKLRQSTAAASLPVSMSIAKADSLPPSSFAPTTSPEPSSSVAQIKTEAPVRHAATAVDQPALVAANAPSKILADAKEGPAPDASSDFAMSLPAPPPVISSAAKNVVLAAPDPVHYTEAKPVFAPQPTFPQTAKEIGAQGDVLVNVEIDASGHVTATRARSGNPLLIEPAVSAARLWKFEPATRNGKPIASLKTLRFRFTSH
ncbi:MAG TPA: TonB family protein [Terriglobales bacterium]